MSDEAVELIKDQTTAQIEAEVIRNKVTPEIKRAVISTANEKPDLQKTIEPLAETGYLELGSQRLDQIKKEYPDYYESLMARQEAIMTLTESLRPSYTDEIWEDHHLTPSVAREKANSVSVDNRRTAEQKARETATAIIDGLTSNVSYDRKKALAASGYILEEDLVTNDRVNKEIRHEIDDGHILDKYTIVPRQIGAMYQGVWASLNAIREEKLVKSEFSLNIDAAIQKQAEFDRSKLPVPSQPAS